MAESGSEFTPWRYLALCAANLAVTPLWLAVNPAFWLDLNAKGLPANILATAAGVVLVGAAFLFLTILRAKPPSVAFAFAVPGLGVLGYALTYPLMSGFSDYAGDAISYGYTGLLWAYLFGCFVTWPLAALHTWLMIRVVKPRTKKTLAPPLVQAAGQIDWSQPPAPRT